MNIEQQLTAPPRLGEQRIILRGIRWQTYEALLQDLQSPGIRLAYDRGELEIMGPLYLHEWCKNRLRILVLVLCEELGLEVGGAGSMTIRREDLERGIEVDECFYIQHLSSMLGRRDLDRSRDPPPDLGIEVDITSSSLDRQGIYEALGIGELWRFNGESLRIFVLRPEGKYEPTERSRCFPRLPLVEAASLIQQSEGVGDVAFTRRTRDWVRSHLAPGPSATDTP